MLPEQAEEVFFTGITGLKNGTCPRQIFSTFIIIFSPQPPAYGSNCQTGNFRHQYQDTYHQWPHPRTYSKRCAGYDCRNDRTIPDLIYTTIIYQS
jgi:hypothetical protein